MVTSDRALRASDVSLVSLDDPQCETPAVVGKSPSTPTSSLTPTTPTPSGGTRKTTLGGTC
jgi:hypothetical protein